MSTGDPAPPDTSTPVLRAVVGWGSYLASSWTWCIGMFLPILLIRDFGPMGFVVFAVPNVLGAALFGRTFNSPGQSERFLKNHARACVLFSAVTVLYQWFFLLWLVLGCLKGGGVLAPPAALPLLGASVTGHLLGRATFSDRRALPAATIATALSLLCIAAYLGAGGLAGPTGAAGIAIPPLGQYDWAALAPVCVLGFGLCPYLDLTFHRARQKCPGTPGTAAFFFGFFVLFLAMILFTRAYAPAFSGPLAAPVSSSSVPLLALSIHIGLQLGFTQSLHAGLLFQAVSRRPARQMGLFAAMAIGALALGAVAAGPWYVFGLPRAEVIYRLFLSFYGLVFPAYVLLLATGRGSPELPSSRRLLWISILLAAPFYWLGFVQRQSMWLLAGVGVLLAARLLSAVTMPRPRSDSSA